MKKSLLIVNDLLLGGGVEKLIYDFVWQWHERYDLTVITMIYEPKARRVLPPNVHYHSVLPCFASKSGKRLSLFKRAVNKLLDASREKVDFRLVEKYARIVDRTRFDTVLSMKDGWCMGAVSRLNDIPQKLVWVHTDYNADTYSIDALRGEENTLRCMKIYDHIVCVAEQIKTSIQQTVGDPGNLLVRYNPIRVNEILVKAQEPVVDIEPFERENGPLFVTVGRLHFQKGYDLLLEACHMLERDGLSFHVLIVGAEQPWSVEHKCLYRRQKQLGLKSVRFLGGRSNPYKYMKCADWFISSSVFEGYSLVSQEAAVLDVPMLLTDCSGVREFLGDSEYGIVMDISVLSIYENMKRVIEHPELREHYREKIMERKKTINFDERIAAIEELFDKDQAE